MGYFSEVYNWITKNITGEPITAEKVLTVEEIRQLDGRPLAIPKCRGISSITSHYQSLDIKLAPDGHDEINAPYTRSADEPVHVIPCKH